MPPKVPCKFYALGKCTRTDCLFSHSVPTEVAAAVTVLNANANASGVRDERRRVCAYFLSAAGCRYGAQCRDRHTAADEPEAPAPPTVLLSPLSRAAAACPSADPAQCVDYACEFAHPASRRQRCSRAGACADALCSRLHPPAAWQLRLAAEPGPVRFPLAAPKLEAAMGRPTAARHAHVSVLLEACDKAKPAAVLHSLNVRATAWASRGSAPVDSATTVEEQKVKELRAQLASFDSTMGAILDAAVERKGPGLEHYYGELVERLLREVYRFKAALPALALRGEIDRILPAHACVVIKGETGSGKSTQVPQYVAELLAIAQPAGPKKVLCTQPRKVAAVSLAERVAGEWASGSTRPGAADAGGAVAYRVGGKSTAKPWTVIEYQTEGTLINLLLRSKASSVAVRAASAGGRRHPTAIEVLAGVGAIVLDEAHERSVTLDVLIGVLREGQRDGRWPHLKIIVTSATIDTSLFSAYLGGAPVIEIPGRMHPVEVRYCPLHDNENVLRAAVKKARDVHADTPVATGDILVFLTGADDVDMAVELFKSETSSCSTPSVVMPLYGRQLPEEQRLVFDKPPLGARKVVFSTDVAETSVTIDGVCHVIDCGLAKEIVFDPRRNVSVLETAMISRSSADQRKGRAGRTAPGTCYRLFALDDYASMRTSQVAEVLSRPLELTIVTLRAMGLDPTTFPWMEAPAQDALTVAEADLRFMGAVDAETGSISQLGELIADLQVDPGLARLVYSGCLMGYGDAAATLAGLLSAGSSVFWRVSKSAPAADRARVRDSHAAFFSEAGEAVALFRLYKRFTDVLDSRSGAKLECGRSGDGRGDEEDDNADDNRSTSAQTVASDVLSTMHDAADAADADFLARPAVVDAASVVPRRYATAAGGAPEVAARKTTAAPTAARVAHTWCREHHLNSKSLGSVSGTARTFVDAAKRVGLWDASPSQQGAPDDATLQALTLRAQFLNVAVWSGGGVGSFPQYTLLRTDRLETAFIHPSSSWADRLLNTRAEPPKWIVYGNVIETTKTFLTVCTPLAGPEALEHESPEFAAAVQRRLQRVRVFVAADDVSPGLLRRLFGHALANKSRLEDEMDAALVVDLESATLGAWCDAAREATVRAELARRIAAVRDGAWAELEEEAYGPNVRVLYGKGGHVDQLLFGDEFITVNFANLPYEINHERLRLMLGADQIRSLSLMQRTRVRQLQALPTGAAAEATPSRPAGADGPCARVTFHTPAQAKAAQAQWNNEYVEGKQLRVSPGGVVSPAAAVVNTSELELSWATAPPKGTVLLKFKTAAAANNCILRLRAMPFLGSTVHAIGCPAMKLPAPNQRHLDVRALFRDPAEAPGQARAGLDPLYAVRLKKVPLTADEFDLEAHLFESGCQGPDYVFGRIERGAASPPTDVPTLGAAVVEGVTAVAASVAQLTAEMVALIPLADQLASATSFLAAAQNRAGFKLAYRGGRDTVVAALRRWELDRATDAAAGCAPPSAHGQPVRLRGAYKATLNVHRDLFAEFVQPLLAIRLQALSQRTSFVTSEFKDRVSIRLQAERPHALDMCTHLIFAALMFTIFVPARGDKALLFTVAGRARMEEIGRNDAYVHWDNMTRNIRVYGDEAKRVRGVARLQEALDALTVLWQSLERVVIRVTPHGKKAVIEQRQEFVIAHGLADLQVSGFEVTAVGAVTEIAALGRALAAHTVRPRPLAAGRGAPGRATLECPLCFSEIDARYELTACGHGFCLTCLKPQFADVENGLGCTLPVSCHADGCSRKAWAWNDIVAVASTKALGFLKQTAVAAYVQSNPTVVRKCPVPECMQLIDVRNLRPSELTTEEQIKRGGATVTCDTCNRAYCLTCSDRDSTPCFSHPDFTCSSRQLNAGAEMHVTHITDKLLNLHCPRCNRVFLDFDGCFAVQCGPPCSCSFCGFCLADCGSDAHGHVRSCPQNPTPGEYFNTKQTFHAIHRNRFRNDVLAYVRQLPSLELRQAVLAGASSHLRFLSITIAANEL
jgi:HrpA-like RNA helicase